MSPPPSPHLERAEKLLAVLDGPGFEQGWAKLSALEGRLLDDADAFLLTEPALAVRAWQAACMTAHRGPQSRAFDGRISAALPQLDADDGTRVGLMLIRSCISRGEFAAAQAWSLATGVAGSDAGFARIASAHIAIRTGHFDEAREQLEALGDEAQGTFRVRLQRALLHIAERDHAVADVEVAALQDLAASEGRALSAAMLTFVTAENEIAAARWHTALDAIDHAQSALAPLGPSHPTIVLASWKARVLRHLGRAEEALAAAESSLQTAQRWGLPEMLIESACEVVLLSHGEARDAAALRVRQLMPLCARPDVVERARQALGATPPAPRPRVAHDGSFVEVEGNRISLTRRPSLRRILGALVAAERDDELDVARLFEVGWPGESIAFESAKKRVYTAIWQLRRMGLGDNLVHDGERYRLTGVETATPPTT